jgi:acyl-CoA carboxylase subunit beta
MQRPAEACAAARASGIPQVSVVWHPTTGGVWVSLASTTDVIIGVKGATVAFAGPRARGDGARPEPEFTPEGKHAAGFVDIVASADDVPTLTSRYVRLLSDIARPAVACPVPAALGSDVEPGAGWDSVRRARSPGRPNTTEYFDRYFSERVTISGDRVGGRDEGMLCGFGDHDGATAAFVAQTGRANSPAGFRAATRLIRLADRLSVPILTLINPPGADPSASEASGTATAIGETFIALRELRCLLHRS